VPRIVQLVSLLALVAVALVYAAAAPGARRDGNLVAKVGPGFSISLTDASGAPVKQLDPGTYTIAVDDESAIHNFDLFGPGVQKSTDIAATGTTSWSVTFSNGVYTFQCDAHVQTMKGTFTVGTGVAPAPPPAPKPTPKPKAATKLVASVGPGQTIALRRTNGALVRTLPHGRYAITVHDRAGSHNFHLIGPGLNRKTGVPFVGTVAWAVTLKKGTYAYRCDPHAPFMHGSFKVT
jgi:plastocyanin